MKLILEKNFVTEIKELDRETYKNSVRYYGRTLKGDEIELYDKEAGKIAPIVRFLLEKRKSKISWLLIIGAGLLLIFFFVLMLWIFWPKDQVKQQPQEVVQPVVQPVQPVQEIQQGESNGEEEKNISLELVNEVGMMTDLKNNAELETKKLTYEIEDLKRENDILYRENELLKQEKEKLTNQVNNLKKENKELTQRKIELPSDEFIYYLGESVFDGCEKATEKEKIEKCQSIYYNFLKYENSSKDSDF